MFPVVCCKHSIFTFMKVSLKYRHRYTSILQFSLHQGKNSDLPLSILVFQELPLFKMGGVTIQTNVL